MLNPVSMQSGQVNSQRGAMAIVTIAAASATRGWVAWAKMTASLLQLRGIYSIPRREASTHSCKDIVPSMYRLGWQTRHSAKFQPSYGAALWVLGARADGTGFVSRLRRLVGWSGCQLVGARGGWCRTYRLDRQHRIIASSRLAKAMTQCCGRNPRMTALWTSKNLPVYSHRTRLSNFVGAVSNSNLQFGCSSV